MANILELDHKQARAFLLDGKSYVNFDLPEYFNFDPILQAVSSKMGGYDVNYFFDPEDGGRKKKDPRDRHDVNKVIYGNKDGELAWRPFEIINPVLYVGLVHYITKEDNWSVIKKRFSELRRGCNIEVASIPVQPSKKKSAKAEQIRAWWEKFEQNCAAKGLEFRYVLETDVANCYGSIYTHSISWALHGKDEAYANRDKKSLGGKIDEHFQMMNHRQTNGIPQGNTLSDFIAELIFAYADNLLAQAIKDIDKREYSIVRYRDDYRIFTNRLDLGARILKELTEILAILGLRLNAQKTKKSSDIVLSSIKKDKIEELFIPNIKKEKDNFAKWLMQIYAASYKYPNSGMVSRQLNMFHEELLDYLDQGKSLRHYEKPEVMLSIVVNMAIKNPKYYNMAMAVASLTIRGAGESRRGLLVQKILDKFKIIPNTGLLDIWLQRVSYSIDPDLQFNELLTRSVSERAYIDNSIIWCIDWLKDDIMKTVRDTSIVDVDILQGIRETNKISIDRQEVDLFRDIPS
ncbi:hypothetical protein TM7x_03560 [Candidatus Nanosynbacter lyticus]|uniref:Reverse transcriptase domain-containing protein n=2 Tax=Candidatus Saccharimonadota TaxID=95818 RepID=A0A6S4GV19_9BACT|nr:RNA-directed DNA polymerase [Candidatus Nanosynbacter lyticus]AJA06647.1 hypothetical protein TM7x_03560 [Candidatus Nanosynbacter lyticus]